MPTLLLAPGWGPKLPALFRFSVKGSPASPHPGSALPAHRGPGVSSTQCPHSPEALGAPRQPSPLGPQAQDPRRAPPRSLAAPRAAGRRGRDVPRLRPPQACTRKAKPDQASPQPLPCLAPPLPTDPLLPPALGKLAHTALGRKHASLGERRGHPLPPFKFVTNSLGKLEFRVSLRWVPRAWPVPLPPPPLPPWEADPPPWLDSGLLKLGGDSLPPYPPGEPLPLGFSHSLLGKTQPQGHRTLCSVLCGQGVDPVGAGRIRVGNPGYLP